jgi:uncharacterized protein involved in outer membrane biogenesis
MPPMPASKFMRRGLIGVAALLVMTVIVLTVLVVGLDAGYFRGTLLGYLERSTGRKITVSGPLEVRLLSRHPSVSAHGVTIGNPPWTPPGITAQIDFLSLVYDWPPWGAAKRIESLRMQGARLTLFRDATGHANWQRRNPDEHNTRQVALIASLTASNAHVIMNDERRHLKFDGTVSAQDATRADGAAALQIQGSGVLNGANVALELTGDALSGASHDQPYRFSFSEKASGSVLTAEGSLPKPFDFNFLEANFVTSGPDLKDLYLLTGVSLINTGAYRLTGHYSRGETQSRFTELRLSTGQSDLSGSVLVDAATSRRPRTTAKLHAQRLRSADFGLRAAGRQTVPYPLLISNAPLNPEALRRGDASIDFDAQRFEVGRESLQDVALKLTFERGLVTAAPVTAGLLGGKLSGQVKIDVTQDSPRADVDLTLTGLQLDQLPHKSPEPPLDGSLRAHIKFTGHGRSAHEVAASAEGTATFSLPQGTVRASLAELAGLDLRGLGLTLENSKRDTPIRCAVANFQAHGGVFSSQRLVMDTEPVRIQGEGSVHMDTETLDLVLRGEPKSLRVLRLKAPLLIRGTLAHPELSIEKSDSKLMLVDKGRGKDEDCSALLQ